MVLLHLRYIFFFKCAVFSKDTILLRCRLFYALSSYKYKITLDCPNYFGRIQIILVRFKLPWFYLTNFYNLDLSKMVLDQNYLDGQNHFGPKEGEGIILFYFPWGLFFKVSFVYVLLMHAKILEGNFWVFVNSMLKSPVVTI